MSKTRKRYSSKRGARRGRPAMRRRRVGLAVAAIVAGLVIILFASGFQDTGDPAPEGEGTVRVIEVEGVIDPLAADYIIRNLQQAKAEQARAAVIVLDTPGGLDEPMREIIKEMTESPLAVMVYVAPSGSRAASAGTFIVMAADLAAMAPGTNLGAAHPIIFGVDAGSTEEVKATNDAAAYIRSLAEAAGRNANWAELAVRQSVSLSADEALEQQVIDMQAGSLEELLEQAGSFEPKTKDLTLNTRGAEIVRSQATLKESVLKLILNPNVAYFLFLYGLLALAYELVNPGIGLSGVSGGVSLVLSFYAMRILPVNLTGLALVLVGIVLLATDLYVTSHGALSAGGIIAIVIGSFFLFDAPFLRVSLPLNLALAAMAAGFFLIAARKVMKARRLPPRSGRTAMIGEVGVARTPLDPLGQVFVHGEIWSAEAPEGEIIEKGEEVEVVNVRGLMLKVKKTV